MGKLPRDSTDPSYFPECINPQELEVADGVWVEFSDILDGEASLALVQVN